MQPGRRDSVQGPTCDFMYVFLDPVKDPCFVKKGPYFGLKPKGEFN